MAFLKKLACTLLFLSFHLTFAQTETATLLRNIANEDAYIVMTRTMSPRVNGESAHRIIEIGKAATPELIQVLDSRNKGIAAHFILSEIWHEQWEEAICCMIHSEGTIEIVDLNGLQIQIENDVLSATEEALKNNKENWKKRTHA